MEKFTDEYLGGKATPVEMKARLAEMLKSFDQFCNDNGLTYYLSGGTLLGAIRHKGFIPWDDDVDVNMPRPDCERLMELTGGKLGIYTILPPNFDQDRHAYHWKMYDTSMLVKKGAKKAPYPIFMDIFPIEGLPKTEKGNIAHFNKIKKWKYFANNLFSVKRFYGKNVFTKLLNGTVGRIVAKAYGREKLFNKVLGVMKSLPYETSEYIGVMATNVHTTEERVLKAEYSPIIKVEFEGMLLNGPAGYDKYLTQLYGDYMQLPPEEKRVSHNLKPYYRNDYDISNECTIAILGLVKSQNLGEMFIARSLEYLIEQGFIEKGQKKHVNFAEVDILGRKELIRRERHFVKEFLLNYSGSTVRGIYVWTLYEVIKKYARKTNSMFIRNILSRFNHMLYRNGRNLEKRLYNYYSEKMADADFIVVDGAGLLEYSYNEYQEPLRVISQYAKDNGLKVVYNAIGRAGDYNEKDFRSSMLRKAIRSDVVKYVSARDSAETVQEVAGPGHNVKLLADAAFWLKEKYQPAEPETRKKVGIGLVRGNSLLGYGIDFGAQNWVQLFSGIAWELEKRGYEFEFFTNGLPGDVVLGRKILDFMGLDPEYLVERPTDDTVLYDTINGYKGIITCRMHSSIAAFTLGVPSVIMSWNDKVVKLMEIVGYPERAITLENFNPVLIVDRFEAALQEGVAQEKVDAMKAKAKESVDGYIDLVINEVNDRAYLHAASK